MRWRRPTVGDVRTVRRFLIFPKTLRIAHTQDRETRWLEYATWEEQFKVNAMGRKHWSAVRWSLHKENADEMA